MPFQIVRNDITKMRVDAIVNAANSSLLGGGGVDGCIHRAAGPELLAECRKLGGCPTGSAKITKGYRLPAKYVIHAVGPVWRDGSHGEEDLLKSCYTTALRIAKDHKCRSIAFPLISSGIYGYPKDQALEVAVGAIAEFLKENEMQVYLVIFDKTSFQIAGSLHDNIQAYIDENYVEEHSDADRMMNDGIPDFGGRPSGGQFRRELPVQRPAGRPWEDAAQEREEENDKDFPAGQSIRMPGLYEKQTSRFSLEEALGQIDESFSEMLLRKIDESGMTDAECYKKANIDRKLFSKIKSNKNYKPSKPTVLAFAIALELPMGETVEMLMKAGFALSHSSKFDIIVEYFLEQGNYNIYEINEALFAFDQSLIGN